jgi:hypothetical protein
MFDKLTRGLILRFNLFFVFSLLGLLCGFPALYSAGATTVVPLSQEALIEDAVGIVTGRVTLIESFWDAQQRKIFTHISLSVEEKLKGDFDTTQLILKQTGGRIGDLHSWIEGSPEFTTGEKVLVFLGRNRDASLRVAHLFQGKFSIFTDASSGEEIMYRGTPAGVQVRPAPGASTGVSPQHDQFESLTSYKLKVQEVLQKASQPLERRRSSGLILLPQLSSTQTEVQDGFTFFPTPFRWFEPDSFNSVPMRINSAGEPLAPTSGFDQIRAGLQAWSVVTGTNFRFRDAGFTTAAGFENDGVNAVSFRDPLGEIDNPVGCTGTLAVGGGFFDTNQSLIVNGQEFKRMIEGDIAFNDGWEGCGFYENFANFAEVATHELGHVLGLGHSADADATMFFQAHFDGRGAALRQDDVDGLRFIYPGTSLVLDSLDADTASPQPLGSTIMFTAATSGGAAPIQFKWWLFNGTAWSVVRDWSASNTFSWTPSTQGDYMIAFWARGNGNNTDAPENNLIRTRSFSISGPALLTVTSLLADKASPQPLGTTIGFTATSSGGTAPIQFKWWVFNGTVWSVGQNWSASNTFNWRPGAGGNYTVAVWARSSGATADAAENNALRSMAFTITASAGAQVRAFNNLLFCNPSCTSFTGRLRASEGYTWTAVSGTFSSYQSVPSSVLSNFVAEAVGLGAVINFPVTFNIVSGRRYALMITVDGADNPVLLLVDEGPMNLSVSGNPPASSKAVLGRLNASSPAHFALAGQRSAGR